MAQTDHEFLELCLEPLWQGSSSADQYTSCFSSSTGAILLGRGGCEPPEPKWKINLALGSRRHCWFQHSSDLESGGPGGHHVRVVDVSRGGTFVNGKPVSRTKGTALFDGDVLSLVNARPATSDEDFRAWNVRIKSSRMTYAGSSAPELPQSELVSSGQRTSPWPKLVPFFWWWGGVSTAQKTNQENSSFSRPFALWPGERISFQIARPEVQRTFNASGYTAEAREFLSQLPLRRQDSEDTSEPEPEEATEEPEEAPEEAPDAHEDQEKELRDADGQDVQVAETTELIAQLQLDAVDTSAEGQTDYPEQYAIIDTNQLLEHLDAVNSILENIFGVNIIVPVVVLHELDRISKQSDSRATAARCARSFLERFISGKRCSAGHEASTISLQKCQA